MTSGGGEGEGEGKVWVGGLRKEEGRRRRPPTRLAPQKDKLQRHREQRCAVPAPRLAAAP